MKRNNLIAIAVGTIMGAALSSAYADEPPAPAPDNRQMSRHADNDDQQGPFDRYHDARHGVAAVAPDVDIRD